MSDNSTGKKKLLFNIVLAYAQLRNPEDAKKYLDQIEDDRLVANPRELALLYESLAVLFTIEYGEKEKFKTIAVYYQLAALNFRKCKEWSQSVRNKIEAGRILQENNFIKESIVMADQVTTEFIYLDESNESAEILNNLAILYSKDHKSRDSVIKGGKLLKKTIKTFYYNKQTELALNSNYIGVLNQLGIKSSKTFEILSKSINHEFASETKIFCLFNMASNKFYSSDYNSALELFLDSLAFFDPAASKDKNISSEILECISICYYNLKDYEKFYSCLREALNEAVQNKSASENSSTAIKRIEPKLVQAEKIVAKEKDSKPFNEVESQGNKLGIKSMILYSSQQEEVKKQPIEEKRLLNISKIIKKNILAKEPVEAD
ncbi:hypothetical protein BpHYR1_040521 [Brachionus plicatilis]|uniref:Uncharacterized protein n=1 Tax=Brachionus plicatilis TaxID=10195 RepID=A0A3M7PNN6_BRAPC|nr:hypothetical protein BpHYR1_040521 [Brachionus plicatilis]